MVKVLLGLLFLVSPLLAGTYTSNYSLYKPVQHDTDYIAPFATSMDTIDLELYTIATSTGEIQAQLDKIVLSTGPVFAATHLNTPGAIVKRDASGDFLSGQIVVSTLTAGYVAITTLAVDSNVLVVQNNYVGIGTDTPTVPLDVYGNMDIYGTIQNWDSLNTNYIGPSGIEALNNADTKHLRILANTVSYIDTGYNFGIGIRTPTRKFEVIGDSYFSSTFTVDGQMVVNSSITANDYYGNGSNLIGMSTIFSTTTIVASTGTIQASLDLVILSTGVIQASLNSVILSTGVIQASLNEVIASTHSIYTLHMVDTLPTTGYGQGSFLYLTTDPTKLYISTETVVDINSWLAK